MEDRRHKLQSCFEHIVIPNSCDSQELIGSKPVCFADIPQRKIWRAHTLFRVGADGHSKYLHHSFHAGKPTFVSIWNFKAHIYGAHGKQTKSNVDASVQKQTGH